MPVRLAVHLRSTAGKPAPPPHTGPAANAAVLAQLGSWARELATWLHDMRVRKAYTMTPLLDESDLPATARSADVRFEFALLDDRVADARTLQLALGRDRTTGDPATYTVHGSTYELTYEVDRVDCVADLSYAQLLSAARPRRTWSFRVLTPLGFATARDEGARRSRPWPDPERVFTGLERRWHAFCGDSRLADETGVAVLNHLELTAGRLEVREHLVNAHAPRGRGKLRGVVGEVTFGLADAGSISPDAAAGVDALARYAAFAGMGDRTPVGMGHVVSVPAGRHADHHGVPAPSPRFQKPG